MHQVGVSFDLGESLVDIWHNVRFAHISICTIYDNAGRITESTKSGTEMFVLQDNHGPISTDCTKNYGCVPLTLLLYYEKINILYRNVATL